MKKYPINLKINYPEKSSRLTALFRLILAIPIIIILALVSSSLFVFLLAVALLIIFREKYPKWCFDYVLAITKLRIRVEAYILLLVNVYPSSDEDQAVTIEIPYPNVKKDLNRYMPIFKWVLAIPHFIVLLILTFFVILGTIFALFAILFTGKYPGPVFNFVEGCFRWKLRVNSYSMLLVTDEYPPFRLEE